MKTATNTFPDTIKLTLELVKVDELWTNCSACDNIDKCGVYSAFIGSSNYVRYICKACSKKKPVTTGEV